jgi:hypothetical protein
MVCLEGSPGRVPPSVGKRSRRERQSRRVISPSVLFHELKLCLLIHLFFRQSTPLHKSAKNGHTNVCRLLLENAADVNARDCM